MKELLIYLRMKIPMSMDASASAYQIMSYFTFNEKFALATNLFRDIVHTSEELHDFDNSLFFRRVQRSSSYLIR